MRKAVTIQEQFDVEVFGLEWNDGLAGPKEAPEDIHTAAQKIQGMRAAALRDWYPEADAAPWPLNVSCANARAPSGDDEDTTGTRSLFWRSALLGLSPG